MENKDLMAMNEYKNVKNLAIEKGLKKLKELGWVNITYKKYSQYKDFSDFSVMCGYDGAYQKAKLVKGFD